MAFIVSEGCEPVPGYKVIRKLGEGGFGTVWEAEAPGGVHVALKAIRLQSQCSATELRALELIRNIRHPHLLDVQFWLKIDDIVLIAMPLCDESLWNRLLECRTHGRAGIPRRELLGYVEDLAKAVDYLNEPRHVGPDGTRIGIQHRDIKPHNVFLVGGSVRLADFSLAKFLGGEAASHTGGMTAAYVAPEALKGVVASRSDQYSLAVTYYELAYDKLPFAGKTFHELIYNQLHSEPDLTGLAPGDLPALRRALAKEPGERWPNCQAFVSALKQEMPSWAKAGATTSTHQLLAGDPIAPDARGAGNSAPAGITATPTLRGFSSYPTPGPDFAPRGPDGPDDEGLELAVSAERRTAEPGHVLGTGVGSTTTSPVPDPRPERRLWPRVAAAGLVAAAGALAVSLALRGGGADHLLARGADHGNSRVTDDGVTGSRHGNGRPPASAPRGAETTSLTARTSPTGGASPAVPVAPVAAAPKVERRVVRFEPPDAEVEVTVDGEPRHAVAGGRVEIEAPPDAQVEIVARAEGFKEFHLRHRFGDLDGSGKAFRLEADGVPMGRLARAAYELLRTRCHGCHGVQYMVTALDVLDRDALVRPRDGGQSPYLVPGSAERSVLWKAAGNEGHPGPGPRPAPTDEERRLLRRWIDAGAPADGPHLRRVRTERDVWAAVRDHLHQTPEADRPYQRYFSFAGVHNNPAASDEDLRFSRAALSKLVNSLSRKPEVVVPAAADPEGLVLAVDLRALGWDDNLWNRVLGDYSYGLTHENADDPAHDAASEVRALNESATELPCVRADWFVAAASRPPLYHTLLRLPKTVEELEAVLKVDAAADFRTGAVARAGHSAGRISGRPQVAERHESGGLAYWKLFDLRPGQDLARLPLEPSLPGHPYPRHAFDAAATGVLFQLPNGLLGYLLADGRGKRVDAAPAEAGIDPSRTAGGPALVNGLSCLACHRQGVFPLEDEVRAAAAGLNAAARARVERLYPPVDKLRDLVDRDGRRVLDAQERAARPFLRTADGPGPDLANTPEPIGALARRFAKDLSLDQVAGELGLADPTVLREKIRNSAALRNAGLKPLADGGTVPRDVWREAFGITAVELEVGVYYRSS
jgi:serine/threonine-protein kinase